MTFSTEHIFKALMAATAAVALAGWMQAICLYVICPGMDPITFLDLDAEANLPTWWSSTLLLICAVLAALTAALRKNQRFFWGWLVIALGLLFMSMDEVSELHEKLSGPIRDALHLSGFLYYGWLVPGAALLLVVGLSYIRFFLALPSKTQRGFVLGGIVYLGGAMGMETWGGLAFTQVGAGNLTYALLAALEETLEMAGLVILVRVFLNHVQDELAGRGVTLSP